MRKLLCMGLLLMVASLAMAQAVPAATSTSANLENIYGAGVSYNMGATPAVSGTALYAHLAADTGTYLFTAVDALPASKKPFTVTTNFGAGIGQKIMTIGKVPIYVPTAAGISFNGVNTGWQWNGGVLASIHLKGNYYLMPCARFLRSNVSGDAGYQPILGVLIGWGQ